MRVLHPDVYNWWWVGTNRLLREGLSSTVLRKITSPSHVRTPGGPAGERRARLYDECVYPREEGERERKNRRSLGSVKECCVPACMHVLVH
jgi:hypothetical protein